MMELTFSIPIAFCAAAIRLFASWADAVTDRTIMQATAAILFFNMLPPGNLLLQIIGGPKWGLTPNSKHRPSGLNPPSIEFGVCPRFGHSNLLLLRCAAQLVIDNLCEILVRLISRQKPSVDEQRRSSVHTNLGAFENFDLDGGGMFAGVQ